MKKLFALVMVVSCVITSVAGIGETQEEAIKRYGEPDIMAEEDSGNSSVAMYFKTQPNTINFFKNKDRKSIVGKLAYQIPKELTQDLTLAEPEILKILGEHADGQIWMRVPEDNSYLKNLRVKYCREGATASSSLPFNTLNIELDEYTEFKEEESERQEAEQSKALAAAQAIPYITQIEKGLKSQFYYTMIPRGRIQVMSALSSQMESPNLRQKRFSINILESLDAYQKQGLISYTEQEQSDIDLIGNMGARNYTVTILQKAIDASDSKVSNNDFLYISKGECTVLSVVKDIPYTHRDLAQSDDFRLVVGTYSLTNTQFSKSSQGEEEREGTNVEQVFKFRAFIKVNPFNKTYSFKVADWGYINSDDWMTSNISD